MAVLLDRHMLMAATMIMMPFDMMVLIVTFDMFMPVTVAMTVTVYGHTTGADMDVLGHRRSRRQDQCRGGNQDWQDRFHRVCSIVGYGTHNVSPWKSDPKKVTIPPGESIEEYLPSGALIQNQSVVLNQPASSHAGMPLTKLRALQSSDRPAPR